MSYTQQDYERERAICDKADAYARETMAKRGKRCNYITADEAAAPVYAACDNATRSRVERYEIFRDKPDRIFAYLSSDCANVTTWTGDNLGTVSMGRKYRSNMGDLRYPFRTTIAGRDYSGIGYGGGDMYCRLRALKGSRA